MGCGHSDRKSSGSRTTASASSSPDRRDAVGAWCGGRVARGGDNRHADDAFAHYNNYGAVGFHAGFPVHRITKVTQVEQVDVCEEQNNKISLHDDYNNSQGFPEVLTINGSWIYGLNAGGSRNNLDMFETNPQYLLKFPTGIIEENLFVTIKIILKIKRIHKKNPLHVAFFLFKNDCEQKETLGAEYFLCTEPEGSSGVFKSKQMISETFIVSTLRSYVIVPATFKPFQQGEFVIKVMVDRKIDSELKKLIPPTRPSVGNIHIQ
ncbi:calpain-3-like [Rhopalosiphum padi]|uniref:calpain-3-like n=1 Tax=Rhopalosiphum padi TaxID=40932 RepID=UPI00298E8CEB|nr:calpain-3-like [Rhopalosiphum padi]